MITIRKATNEDASVVVKLITDNGLGAEDVDLETQQYWLAESEGHPAGCIGLECAGKYGLLRSLAVAPDFRNRGIARMLCENLIGNAKEIVDLFLLTNTADQYFLRHGFVREPRERAPKEIQQLKQFAILCPSTSILMKKSL